MTMSADAKGFGHVNKGVIDLSIQTGTGLGFFFGLIQSICQIRIRFSWTDKPSLSRINQYGDARGLVVKEKK